MAQLMNVTPKGYLRDKHGELHKMDQVQLRPYQPFIPRPRLAPASGIPSDTPRFQSLRLRTFSALPIWTEGTSAGVLIDMVSLTLVPNTTYMDSTVWAQTRLEMKKYTQLRFLGAKVGIAVKSPFITSLAKSQLADGTERTDVLSFDTEFLDKLDVHLQRSDFVRDPTVSQDWHLQNGTKHTKVNHFCSNPMHVMEGQGAGKTWHPRNTFFTEAELDSNAPPTRSTSDFVERQTGLGLSAIQYDYPFNYIVGVTGWPNLDLPNVNQFTRSSIIGFTVNMYVDWYFQCKTVVPILYP